MSTINDHRQFSPLFGVRKLLTSLRWSCGFPLKPINNAFNQFVFPPWLEYIKFALYIVVWWMGNSYVFILIMKNQHVTNPVIAFLDIFISMGYSNLDIIVFTCMGFITQASNMMYLYSFRKGAGNISKICLHLTDLNRELFDQLMKINYMTNLTSHRQSLKCPAFGCLLSILGSSMLTSFWLFMVINVLFKDTQVHIAEMLILGVVVFTTNVINGYSPMAISADVVVRHLLSEVGNAFVKWSRVLKFMQHSTRQKQLTESKHDIRQDEMNSSK